MGSNEYQALISEEPIELPNDFIFEAVERFIESGEPTTIPLKGHSMEPLLPDHKCSVTLAPLKREPECGDVFLFRYLDTHILHRLVKIDGDIYYFQGDNVERERQMTRKCDIVAVLDRVNYDDGTVLSCDSEEWKEKTEGIWKPKMEHIMTESQKDKGYLLDYYSTFASIHLELQLKTYDYLVTRVKRPTLDDYWACQKLPGDPYDVGEAAFYDTIPLDCRFASLEEAVGIIPETDFAEGKIVVCTRLFVDTLYRSGKETVINALKEIDTNSPK